MCCKALEGEPLNPCKYSAAVLTFDSVKAVCENTLCHTLSRVSMAVSLELCYTKNMFALRVRSRIYYTGAYTNLPLAYVNKNLFHPGFYTLLNLLLTVSIGNPCRNQTPVLLAQCLADLQERYLFLDDVLSPNNSVQHCLLLQKLPYLHHH